MVLIMEDELAAPGCDRQPGVRCNTARSDAAGVPPGRDARRVNLDPQHQHNEYQRWTGVKLESKSFELE